MYVFPIVSTLYPNSSNDLPQDNGFINNVPAEHDFTMRDLIDPKVAYEEVVENLLYVELYFMLHIRLLKIIKEEKFDYKNLSKKHLNKFLADKCKSFIDEHRSAYNIILKGYYQDFDNISHKALAFIFKSEVASVFEHHKIKTGAMSPETENLYKIKPKYPLDYYGLYARDLYLKDKHKRLHKGVRL